MSYIAFDHLREYLIFTPYEKNLLSDPYMENGETFFSPFQAYNVYKALSMEKQDVADRIRNCTTYDEMRWLCLNQIVLIKDCIWYIADQVMYNFCKNFILGSEKRIEWLKNTGEKNLIFWDSNFNSSDTYWGIQYSGQHRFTKEEGVSAIFDYTGVYYAKSAIEGL